MHSRLLLPQTVVLTAPYSMWPWSWGYRYGGVGLPSFSLLAQGQLTEDKILGELGIGQIWFFLRPLNTTSSLGTR